MECPEKLFLFFLFKSNFPFFHFSFNEFFSSFSIHFYATLQLLVRPLASPQPRLELERPRAQLHTLKLNYKLVMKRAGIQQKLKMSDKV